MFEYFGSDLKPQEEGKGKKFRKCQTHPEQDRMYICIKAGCACSFSCFCASCEQYETHQQDKVNRMNLIDFLKEYASLGLYQDMMRSENKPTAHKEIKKTLRSLQEQEDKLDKLEDEVKMLRQQIGRRVGQCQDRLRSEKENGSVQSVTYWSQNLGLLRKQVYEIEKDQMYDEEFEYISQFDQSEEYLAAEWKQLTKIVEFKNNKLEVKIDETKDPEQEILNFRTSQYNKKIRKFQEVLDSSLNSLREQLKAPYFKPRVGEFFDTHFMLQDSIFADSITLKEQQEFITNKAVEDKGVQAIELVKSANIDFQSKTVLVGGEHHVSVFSVCLKSQTTKLLQKVETKHKAAAITSICSLSEDVFVSASQDGSICIYQREGEHGYVCLLRIEGYPGALSNVSHISSGGGRGGICFVGLESGESYLLDVQQALDTYNNTKSQPAFGEITKKIEVANQGTIYPDSFFDLSINKSGLSEAQYCLFVPANSISVVAVRGDKAQGRVTVNSECKNTVLFDSKEDQIFGKCLLDKSKNSKKIKSFKYTLVTGHQSSQLKGSGMVKIWNITCSKPEEADVEDKNDIKFQVELKYELQDPLNDYNSNSNHSSVSLYWLNDSEFISSVSGKSGATVWEFKLPWKGQKDYEDEEGQEGGKGEGEKKKKLEYSRKELKQVQTLKSVRALSLIENAAIIVGESPNSFHILKAL